MKLNSLKYVSFVSIGFLLCVCIISRTCNAGKSKPCQSIDGCSEGYFCNYGFPYDYGRIHCGSDATPKICEKTSPKSIKINGKTYYYAEERDVKKWCREATCGAASDTPGNCNWGYLAYEGAISWCHSIGKKLANPTDIASHCLEFKKHLPAYQHWAEGQTVVHMESEKCDIQKMVRRDGYANAGSVICE